LLRFTHRPGNEGRDVFGRLAAVFGAGIEVASQPVAGIDAPKLECLQNGEEDGGEFCAPDAAGTVVGPTSCDGIANGVLGPVVVKRHLGVLHKQGQPVPMVEETSIDFDLLFFRAAFDVDKGVLFATVLEVVFLNL
jgi:hypothetical protein